MAIPTGVIFIWSGTNASIPAGWTRETSLDGKFPKGTASLTNPNTTGGSATHTHTSSSHTHTMADHGHTTQIGIGQGGGSTTSPNGDGGSRIVHTHPDTTSGSIANVSVSSTAITYGSVSNNPPYYDVIFIKPSTPAGGLPDQAIGFSDDAGFSNNTGKYNGYYQCDGTNSTPNLTGKYLRGAGTGADAGTTGGSTTNIHNIDHSHTQSHNHFNATAGQSTSESYKYDNNTPSDMVSHFHSHSVSYGFNSDTVTSSGLTVTTSETVEPSHKIINAIQNRSGTPYTPVGIIGMWLGTLSAIPGNFELITSMADYYPKINTSSLGTTGGSNTHTHTGNTHSHTLSHSHSASVSGHSQTVDNDGTGGTGTTANTTHQATVIANNLTLNTATTSANSSSNEPEYRTVAFIKYKGEKGGAFLFNLLR